MTALRDAEDWVHGVAETRVVIAIDGKSADQFKSLSKTFTRKRPDLRYTCL
jgi:hypothetical protein